jgi:hypothetical protein
MSMNGSTAIAGKGCETDAASGIAAGALEATSATKQ